MVGEINLGLQFGAPKFRVGKTIRDLIFLYPPKLIFSLKIPGGQLIIWGL